MPKEIERAAVRQLVEQGAQLVEVLPAREYESQHLPGAIHIPLRKIDSQAGDLLDRRRAVLVYCWDSG